MIKEVILLMLTSNTVLGHQYEINPLNSGFLFAFLTVGIQWGYILVNIQRFYSMLSQLDSVIPQKHECIPLVSFLQLNVLIFGLPHL